eukprot:10352312-Heterocapsa_arctica.AAC.1
MSSLEAAPIEGIEAAVKTMVSHPPALSSPTPVLVLDEEMSRDEVVIPGNHARPLLDSPEPRDTEFVVEGETLWVQTSHLPKTTAARK